MIHDAARVGLYVCKNVFCSARLKTVWLKNKNKKILTQFKGNKIKQHDVFVKSLD